MYNFSSPFFAPNIFSKNKHTKKYTSRYCNYNNSIYNNNFYKNVNYEDTQKKENFAKKTVPSNSPSDENAVLFEAFGLKIYFDDVLIICILLFLYQEKIQDEYLFIALILLLLS